MLPRSSGLCSRARTLAIGKGNGNEIGRETVTVGEVAVVAGVAIVAVVVAAEAGVAAVEADAIGMPQKMVAVAAMRIAGVAAGAGAGAGTATTAGLARGCGTTTATTPTAAGWATPSTRATGHRPLRGAWLLQARSNLK